MNKENLDSHSIYSTKKNDKKQKSFSTYSMQTMPHKQIVLNSSKKSSAANSPQNYQQPQQQPQSFSQALKPLNFTQAASTAAGTLQRQFLEQKLKEKQSLIFDNKTPIGSQTALSCKNKSNDTPTNPQSSLVCTADSGSMPNSSFNVSQTQIQNNGYQKQCSQIQSLQEFDATPCQIQKQNSYATIDDHGGSRRFSVFSKSSFCTSSSFLFGTRIFNKSQKSVPKVNMSTIFKNKAYLYLDEALINTFDDLLDKGYEIVTSKKEERDILKDQEKAMINECNTLEKEITPLIQRSMQCTEQITRQVEVQNQYEKEISCLQEELRLLQKQIESRSTEINNTYDEFTNNIKQMEIENNKIQSDININKACHRQEANSQQQVKKQKEAFLNDLTSSLVNYKAEYENKKMAQADRLRKMENKQKMYIGILKH